MLAVPVDLFPRFEKEIFESYKYFLLYQLELCFAEFLNMLVQYIRFAEYYLHTRFIMK